MYKALFIKNLLFTKSSASCNAFVRVNNNDKQSKFPFIFCPASCLGNVKGNDFIYNNVKSSNIKRMFHELTTHMNFCLYFETKYGSICYVNN